jgi:hypothetical protein
MFIECRLSAPEHGGMHSLLHFSLVCLQPFRLTDFPSVKFLELVNDYFVASSIP